MRAKEAFDMAKLLPAANDKIKLIQRKIEETAMDGGTHIKFKYDKLFIHPDMARFVLDSIADLGYSITIGERGDIVINWDQTGDE